MTAEFILLLTVYGVLIMGIFVRPGHNGGLVNTFSNTLPALSARIEKHIACGYQFLKQAPLKDWKGKNPPPSLLEENPWGL